MSRGDHPPTAPAGLWAWQMTHSPIAKRMYAHRYARRVIDSSGLPAPVVSRIDAIVRRTRLWAGERMDVALELTAHARDALDAGRGTEDVLGSLGDPGPVARLIRRSMKRKRGLVYQARVWLTRALAILIGLVGLSYGVLAARYFSSSPVLRRDYIAELNARHGHLDPEDRAWRVYEDAWVAWQHEDRRLRDESAVPTYANSDDVEAVEAARNAGLSPGADALPFLPADHPDGPAVREALRAFGPTLDTVSAATQREALGFPYSNRMEEIPIEGFENRHRVEPLPHDGTSGVSGSTISVLLPPLGRSRTVARLLVADVMLAAEDGDAPRAAARTEAVFGLSRQLAKEPFLISRLVAMAVHALGLEAVQRMLHQHPGLLDRDQLARLSHAVHASGIACNDLNTESERYFFDDIIQRAYSDDGNGDGRLTPEGLEMLAGLGSGGHGPAGRTTGAAIAANAIGPVAAVAAGSRAEQTGLYDRLLGATRRVLDEGPQHWPEITTVWDELDRAPPFRNFFVSTLAPAMGKAAASVYRSRTMTDATLLAIAVETHRLRTGSLPETLDEIAPLGLPQIPADPFQPGTRLAYTPAPDGTFTVYARGADGDDDGGRPPDPAEGKANAGLVDDIDLRYLYADPPQRKAQGRTLMAPLDGGGPAPDGDWVLYPPVDND